MVVHNAPNDAETWPLQLTADNTIFVRYNYAALSEQGIIGAVSNKRRSDPLIDERQRFPSNLESRVRNTK